VALPLVGGYVSFCFLSLEQRNREQYRACVNAGAALERGIDGVYTALSKPPGDKMSHSRTLDYLMGGTGAILLLFSFWLWSRGGRSKGRSLAAGTNRRDNREIEKSAK